ncbi:MAG: acyl-CoA synthetase [Salinarimonas sp.]|nr:acyl-CoA synthetase [Salinarimonas sp.]
MLPDIRDYQGLYARFSWAIPERYNIGVDVCDRWALIDARRPAVIEIMPEGETQVLDYGDLRDASNRLANALHARGIRPGDRVAVLLPQGRAVPIAHVAIYKLGAIALPLADVFGIDALRYRLGDSGARALITHAGGIAKLDDAEDDFEHPEVILSIDGPDAGAEGFYEACAAQSADFTPHDTLADDPALMIYTSGTTGNPKGALHAHRVLLGHLPGVSMPHEFLPQPGDRFWTPADWAWAGGLLNVLLPGLHFGVPVIARRFTKFDPEAAFRLMADQGVRNAFVPPTALRLLRSVANPRGRFDLALRTLASGGEALGAETFAWGRETLGLAINEFYGQTECNLVVSSCAAIGVSKPGMIGRPVPGHRVAVIDDDGRVCAPDEPGQIAIARPDPVMFLSYWNRPEATQAKFIGDWMTTGDQGVVDADGYIRFVGRDDDVITSSGYRIGPTEIEDCLLRHPAVSLAAVVGKPDPVRTEIVKAFIVAREGVEPDPELADDIRDFVRNRLSAHEYPREIAFRESLPLTTTGKVIRRILRDEA